MGSSSHQANGTLIAVKKIVQHKSFSYQNIDWDYSLLQLNESLVLDIVKRAIELPEQNETIADKTNCLVTGWGNTQNASESRNVLRGTDVPIVNQSKCSRAYKDYGGVTPRMICAGLEEGGKDGMYFSWGYVLNINRFFLHILNV